MTQFREKRKRGEQGIKTGENATGSSQGLKVNQRVGFPKKTSRPGFSRIHV